MSKFIPLSLRLSRIPGRSVGNPESAKLHRPDQRCFQDFAKVQCGFRNASQISLLTYIGGMGFVSATHNEHRLHCKENPIYVFLFWELRGLSPNFHINVSVSDLHIPRVGPHISCSRIGRWIVGIYKSLTDTCMWKLGLWPCYSFSGNICF
jgi:hypothetical protein